ncbi:transglycosylase SLT domain-containing protein [Pseudomonas sp. CFBP 8770]|uniref:lytic transglycosylase domain-containing protein n=1 Tax=unclassified Pseudomonas TaxID=196821 RepID=UPI00178455AF|nr:MULTISPECIES: transglycosylase SLT domain-containing protein [unclassified Pseudomonas]MBD8473406.1 transglycosylase SLT domain-containing protein [Pseudomonas sp. CFBP 8773]MBD8646533.1 transglycosylase SLT domain-containing protein [Pseudomonas sp. CFBP 8770]
MQISSSVKAIIQSAAPTLLAALSLPPPFNLIAAAVASSALKEYLPDNSDDREPRDARRAARSVSIATPENIVLAIDKHNANPQILIDLKKAESDLKRYELESGLKFAEIELEDKKSSRKFQFESGLTNRVFTSGMSLVVIALVSLMVVVVGSLLMIFFSDKIPTQSQNIVVAVFGVVGTIVGFVNGIAANVVSFYWGSSQGSQDKSESIAGVIKDLGAQLGRAALGHAQAESAQPQGIISLPSTEDQREVASPATPAPHNLLSEVLTELTTNHSFSDAGVCWRMGVGGIWIDSVEPNGTMGEPSTIKSIWSRYGDICSKYSKQYGVPVELIVATIAVESAGNPNARLIEAKINDESVGLMQTLVRTARSVLGQHDINGENLLRPDLSIEAGTAYIASQRGTTHFDPPKVAAAYNAGSIRLDRGDKNKWKMLCYPTGTGNHIDKFVEFFNDCMAVGDRLDFQAKGTPSFSGLLQSSQ